ncbi:MAG: FtsQ-type POTRA domain-containing protein [Vicinamibacterales bacterium]
MSHVAAPADRRFRRSHVKPARRGWRWRTKAAPLARYAVVALVLAYGAYRGAIATVRAHVLQVNRIVVRGNERLSQGEILALLNGLRGQNLVWADLGAWRARLLASPWVRDAALRRSLPSTVEVIVLERQPIGIGRIQNEMYVIDDRGVIIDQYGPPYADLDLPIIDGLAASSGQGRSLADGARAELAARVIAALKVRPEIGRRLSQIDVSDLGNAAVILSGDSAVIELGDDQFLSRLQTYLELAPALHERVPEVDSVDVRFDNRIYVRPAMKSGKKR